MSRIFSGHPVFLFLLFLVVGCNGKAGAEGETDRRDLLADFNAARLARGLEPVEAQPALTAAATARATEVAATGAINTDVQVLRQTARRLQRGGYSAHRWIESTLIGSRDDELFEQWEEANPGWLEQAIAGDFEHIGVGRGRFQDRPVVTLMLALSKRTAEWRQADPLRDLEQVRSLALEAVNAARVKAGRKPVAGHETLDRVAQRQAEDMLERAYYSHESPEGTTAGQRVRAAGYRVRSTVAENIAKGLFEPDETVRRWLASPGHRRNILLKRAREVGLGVAYGENENGFEVLWVQVFAD